MDLVISQGEAKQKRPGLFEPKASFQAAAERALEISQIHAHGGSNAGDVYKKLQRLVTVNRVFNVPSLFRTMAEAPATR